MPSGSDTTARRTREADEGCARLLSRQAVEGAPRPATTAGRGELWNESREREQWAEHSAGDAAASSGPVGSDRAGSGARRSSRPWPRLRCRSPRGARSTRSSGSAGRSASRPQATDMREFWTWSAIAALVVGVITLGHDVLGDDLPPQAGGRVGRAAAPDAVQPAHRDHLHRGADGHRGGAVRLHGAGAERRPGPVGGPGPEGRRHRVPVELAVHLPGRHHHDGRPRSPRSAPPTRSRCWCCPPTGRSSSPSAATT